MPTYQYVCTECGEDLEAVQKFSDDPLTVCPHCGGKLRKVFSSVGVVFKGSGFYRTDSRAKPTSESGAAGSDGGKKDAAKPAKESTGSSSSGSSGSAGSSGSGSGSSSASGGSSGSSGSGGSSTGSSAA